MKRLTYVFRCPMCAKLFKMDAPGEPVCSGPSEMRDDHPHTVMHLHAIQNTEVNPKYGAYRAEGPLLLPGNEFCDKQVQREAILLVK